MPQDFEPLSNVVARIPDFSKVAEHCFPEGGYRVCFTCQQAVEVSVKQIAKWMTEGMPCKTCGGNCKILTPEEFKRAKEKVDG